MIIVEDRLRKLFATLPPVMIPDVNDNMVAHSIFFDWGKIEDLNILIKQEDVYPLLWLETGFDEVHNNQKEEVSASLSFKIATSGLNSSLLNQQRISSTFALVLFPTLENIRKAFERSNITEITDRDWNITKFYNWSDQENLETSQVWDALRFDIDLIINNDCLKPFSYG